MANTCIADTNEGFSFGTAYLLWISLWLSCLLYGCLG